MDLALNSLQRLISHKTPKNKQTNESLVLIRIISVNSNIYNHFTICKQMINID